MPTNQQADEVFDPLDPDVLADPHPAYRLMRELHPVHWDVGLQSWMCTRYADCVAILRDSEVFAADFRRVGVPTPPELLSLQTLDPPEQSALRRCAVEALRTRDLQAFAAAMSSRALERLQRLVGQGAFDFVADFADPFTLEAICLLLGIPIPAQDERWTTLNEHLDRSMQAGLEPDALAAGLRARSAFNAFVEEWLAEAREGSLLAEVARNCARAGIEHDIVVNSVRAFWHAGFEVPNRFLGQAVLALVGEHGRLAQLHDGASVGTAVEELVRFAGPVQAVSRACTRPVELGGQSLSEGDVVIALIAAANRDPEVFEFPDELLLDRHPNPHIGFGLGAHACLGLNLARIEARAVLDAILEVGADLEVRGPAAPRRNAVIHGLLGLPLGVRGEVV